MCTRGLCWISIHLQDQEDIIDSCHTKQLACFLHPARYNFVKINMHQWMSTRLTFFNPST